MFTCPTQPDQSSAGIITLVNWTLAPDGDKYLFFWSSFWAVLTDSDIPVDKFRSSERWQLAAISEVGEVIAIFPGCQVKAWIQCAEPPARDCYVFARHSSEKRKTLLRGCDAR